MNRLTSMYAAPPVRTQAAAGGNASSTSAGMAALPSRPAFSRQRSMQTVVSSQPGTGYASTSNQNGAAGGTALSSFAPLVPGVQNGAGGTGGPTYATPITTRAYFNNYVAPSPSIDERR